MALPVPPCPYHGLGTLGLCRGTLHRDLHGNLQGGFCTGAGSAWTPLPHHHPWRYLVISQTHGEMFTSLCSPGHSTCETSPHPCGSVTQETKTPCPGFSSLSVHQKECLEKGDQIQGNFWGTELESSITSAGDAGISHRAELIFSVPAAAAAPALSSSAPPSQAECFGRLLVPNQWTL